MATSGRILLLHRAISNAGDYLIFERARDLFAAFRPRAEYLVGDASQPLERQFSRATLRTLSATVICGGPGFQDRMHPRLYPLAPGVLESPVIFLASGSFIVPGSSRQIADFRFDSPTKSFLDAIAANAPFVGVRDRLTQGMLERLGVPRVVMNGDPAWYDLERISAPLKVPAVVRSIAFTPPAHPAFQAQGLDLLRRIADRYGAGGVTVFFHRGLQPPFVDLARALGCRVGDITGSAQGFTSYESFDLHVGYRLHAHLYCLSRGLVSYLVAEDSRGRGSLETLAPLGVLGFDSAAGTRRLNIAAWRATARLLRRPTGTALPRAAGHLLGTPPIAGELMALIDADLASGFPSHHLARREIRETLPTMRRSIEMVP
jgi:hypothetical protein